MKSNKCHVCKEKSCGDDSHTKTKYKKERNAGDRLKVILLQCYDFISEDNLQKAEIMALLKCLIDEHIVEEDLNDDNA